LPDNDIPEAIDVDIILSMNHEDDINCANPTKASHNGVQERIKKFKKQVDRVQNIFFSAAAQPNKSSVRKIVFLYASQIYQRAPGRHIPQKE
jgi:16S rRNA U1498 N3-methylase RsmE